MSRTPYFWVWAHSGAQNGSGRENPIWTCFVTATWQFWTKNGVKSAFLVGLRQNKAQKWWKHVKICFKRSFSVVLTHFGTHHSTQASSRGAWARMHTRQHFVILTSFELQNRPRPKKKERPFHSFLCAFSSFLGFILPKTDQICTFYANLVQKMTIFEAFGKFSLKNGVKSAFLVGFRQNKAQKWWKHVKICLKRSFSGVWVHLGPKSVSGA